MDFTFLENQFSQDLLILATVVFLAYTIQAMSGFGSVVIGLTLLLHFFPIGEIIPVLIFLNIPFSLWVVVRHKNQLDRSLLFRRILPAMIPGLIAGYLIFYFYQSSDLLTMLFGVFVVLLALRELYFLMKAGKPEEREPIRFFTPVVFAAGITQGLFASGGPVLVYATGRLGLDRGVFRTTLMAVWLILNTMLSAMHFFRGGFETVTWIRILLMLPLMPLAVIAGSWLHDRVNDLTFRISVQLVLLLSGLALVLR